MQLPRTNRILDLLTPRLTPVAGPPGPPGAAGSPGLAGLPSLTLPPLVSGIRAGSGITVTGNPLSGFGQPLISATGGTSTATGKKPPYDQVGIGSPAEGAQAFVTFNGVSGKRWIVDGLVASIRLAGSGSASIDCAVSDNTGTLLTVTLAVNTTVSQGTPVDHFQITDLAVPATSGSFVTWAFATAQTGVLERVSMGAYSV